MDICMANLTVAKMRTEVARQRINTDALNGLFVETEVVLLAMSWPITEILPVGGFVAGAREAWFFNEGFQQNRTICIAGVPVLGQTSANQGEHAFIHGRIRKRALLTMRCKLARRCS